MKTSMKTTVNKLRKLLLVSALLAPLAFGAHQAKSATLLAANSFGNTVTDFSISGLASFDIDMVNFSPVTLTLAIDANEAAAGKLSFNALVRNLIGLNFSSASFLVSTPGVTVNSILGSTVGQFAPISVNFRTAASAGAVFDSNRLALPDTGEGAEAYLGNPLGSSGRTDYELNFSGLGAGSALTVVVAVPEPHEYAFLLMGLGLVGAVARRRQSKAKSA